MKPVYCIIAIILLQTGIVLAQEKEQKSTTVSIGGSGLKINKEDKKKGPHV